MADLSQIKLPSGAIYDVADAVARTNLDLKAPKASPALTGTPTAPTAAAGTNTTQIATTAFVQNAIAANDAMIYKGTIGSSGATVTALPADHKIGWTYKVITAATYAGVACEIGDMIICNVTRSTANDADWTVVQANIDGAVTGPASATDAAVAVFNGTSGKVIKNSGFTIGKSVPSSAVFTDTKNTAGSTDSSKKLYLIGAESQAANPQTYSQDTAYVGTDGCLYSGGSKVLTSHQDISGKKNTQSAVSSPSASGTDLAFIDTISQNAQGVITPTKKTVADMSAATSSAAGAHGLVPAPAAGDQGKFLRGDGTWATPSTGTDTKNTAGSTDTSSKIFLIGATSQAANPQTYSHDTAYVGTDGCLYSGGTKVLTAHQDISGKKNTQSAVSDPTASGNATAFIDSISQDAQGVITPTKKTIPNMGAASSDAAGSAGLVPAPSAGDQAKFLRGDGTWVIPTDTNTDTKVTQAAAITTNGAYPVILAYSTATTSVTNTVNKSANLTYNPSTKALVTGGTVNGYTLAAASAKGVDSSISAGSTSTNLPTSKAVAAFVEGKGYLTSVDFTVESDTLIITVS